MKAFFFGCKIIFSVFVFIKNLFKLTMELNTLLGVIYSLIFGDVNTNQVSVKSDNVCEIIKSRATKKHWLSKFDSQTTKTGTLGL